MPTGIPEPTSRERGYFGEQAAIPTQIQTDICEMKGIPDESLDFIVACHVIEHTPNPALAVLKAHKKLKSGGMFVLVIPDKDATFDRNRCLTTLDHLIADYEMPSRDRDFEHYLEFFRLSYPQPNPLECARAVWEKGDDIHFHTWTLESFRALISYLDERAGCRWAEVWWHPRLSESDIEFYYVLTK